MDFREKLKSETKRCMEQAPLEAMILSCNVMKKIEDETSKMFKVDEVENELFGKIFKRRPIVGDIEKALEEIKSVIETGEFPENFSEDFILCGLHVREITMPCWSYALITNEFVNKLSIFLKDKKALEVMAGRGLLSALLREKGTDIICTDSNGWGGSSEEYAYTEIELIEAEEAVRKYGSSIDYVIMVWPPMGEDSAYRVAKALREVNPNASIIYLGENGGCTADSDFFGFIEDVDDDRFRDVQRSYQQFDKLHDRPYLVR